MALMFRSLRSWLHGGDPLAPLAFEAPLAAIKARVAAGERYFENLIAPPFPRQPAPHRRDRCGRTSEQAEREAGRSGRGSAQARAAMSDGRSRGRRRGDPRAQALQETPIRRRRWPRSRRSGSTTCRAQNKLDPDRGDDAARRAGALPRPVHQRRSSISISASTCTRCRRELLPYVPLFGRALLETGVGKEDFVSLSQRIGRSTGGIRPQRWTSTVPGGASAARRGCSCAARRCPTRPASCWRSCATC